VDARVALAVEATAARRSWPESGRGEPSGALHLLELCGLDEAVASLAPESSETDRAALRSALRRRVLERASAGGEPGTTVVSEGLSSDGLGGEARARFERLRRARWPRGQDRDGPATRAAREPIRPRAVRGRSWERARVRVSTEDRPPADHLLAALEEAEAEAAVLECAFDPWPRRVVRGREADLL
jgi:hypothetical protein